MNKILLYLLIIAVCLLIGVFWGSKLSLGKATTVENSSIVIERIEKVAKLITVEAYLSEIFSHKDFYNFDWSFLRKKALIRVNAKVSAGYDIKKLNILVDGNNKKIFIGPLPKVEILSVDHSLDYFNVEEGIFNNFSPKDYNELNAKAKSFITQKAANHEILKKASEQENSMIDMMRALAQTMGYELVVKQNNPMPN